MNHQFPSLITPDAQAGLALAGKLAAELQVQIDESAAKVVSPGGTNYLSPAPLPREITASVLFYAIAAANRGWIKGT